MHWRAGVLRLLSDPTIVRASRRCPRRVPRRGRPAMSALSALPRLAARAGERATAAWSPGPSTDDLRARRRELAELGRLAVALAMRDAPGP